LDIKLQDLWKSWKCYIQIWIEEEELGTKKDRINVFINEVRTRLEEIELEGEE